MVKMTISRFINRWIVFALVLCSGAMMTLDAGAFTLNVVDGKTGVAIAGGYRWQVEEDATHHVVPGDSSTNFATTFHKSYMPMVAKGKQGDGTTPPTPTGNTHYYVSVLPNEGYSIGGAQVAPGQETVTVYVQKNPIPTAQISVFVFHDNNPLNAAPDLPAETPGTEIGQTDMSGFTVKLEDAGGRYGISAGEAIQDAFGNPLGTTYDNNGNVITLGSGFLVTGPDGQVKFEGLAPGKYGVIVIPPNAVEDPPGSGNWVSPDWQQTNTIEGTNLIDAWVKANEPVYFAEFGPPGWHAFFGFTKKVAKIPPPPQNNPTVATITGTVVNNHLSRPPETAFYNGATFPATTPWVALNANGGTGEAIWVQPTDNGYFEIPNVPAGDYQIGIFDSNLILVFGFYGVTIDGQGNCSTPNGSCALGDVPVNHWFAKLWTNVFNDTNENGQWDPGEGPIPEPATVNLRWRDGTVYQSFPTDGEGSAPFDEMFPFFHWLVAEVDYAQPLKVTGATVVVDAGGPITAQTGPVPGDDLTFEGQLNPQEQSDGKFYRTELGTVLTQAFQGFLGQTSVIQWGKAAWGPGVDLEFGTADDENGGVSGMVLYATTRAEDIPEKAAVEPWEPGIPGMTVNLYATIPCGTNDGAACNADGEFELAADGSYATGELLATTTTDSWDENLPTNCPGDNAMPGVVGANDCFDGMRNWNQVRPGLFDGGYAFEAVCGTFIDNVFTPAELNLDGSCDETMVSPIPAGKYVVEAVDPDDHYAHVRSQDKNVDFGDEYTPGPELTFPPCVGAPYTVPEMLSLFDAPANKAGETLLDCNRKLVTVKGGFNAAADFFMFTEVPIAAHFVGGILDDASNEFDPDSPQFGEKYAPPWLPVGIYDWTGRLIGHTYADQYGKYNALVPSTFTQNLPMPSGISPNMLTTCKNDSNPLADPDGRYNPQYSTFCYTFQYMPGTTTYLDTPVVPIAAMAGPDQFPVDCELQAGTPKIERVDGELADGGPWVASAGQTLTISSVGTAVMVPNPKYCPSIDAYCIDNAITDDVPEVPRDFGFGDSGTATLEAGDGTVYPLNVPVTGWGPTSITGTVPAGTPDGSYQLVVTRNDTGASTVAGITVTVGGPAPTVVAANSNPGATPIQDAIDAASPGDLILVGPGTYNELVIMWKPVRLQGYGAGSTTIRAVKGAQGEKLQAWRDKVAGLVTGNNPDADLLPGQETGVVLNEPLLLFTEEGAGILVLAKRNGKNTFAKHPSRIDGLTITGSDQGGGIVLNGYVDNLQVSNNVIKGNASFYGGGIRSGHPMIDNGFVDADNDNLNIHHNMVAQNGGLDGAGGGVSLYTGTDDYRVTDNFICGNFTMGHGGGIGHLGLNKDDSKNDAKGVADDDGIGGFIARNDILFNESFNQGTAVDGGGVVIAGGSPPAGELSEGSGSVTLEANRILGNLAGAGNGAGIALLQVNGQDVAGSKKPEDWYQVNMFDNIVVNNIAALAGGGIHLRDTVKANIIHNTVARNDSTATAGNAFLPGSPDLSTPQPAGIVARGHHPLLTDALPTIRRPTPEETRLLKPYANPRIVDTIVWQNRSFFFTGPDPYELQLEGFDDLAVLGAAGCLEPTWSVLTSLGPDSRGCTYNGTANNSNADPSLVDEYFNAGRGSTIVAGEIAGIQVPAAFDEGGNFIKVRFGPLSVEGTTRDELYHTGSAVSGLDLTGEFAELADDFDGDPRPSGVSVDIGADEVVPAAP